MDAYERTPGASDAAYFLSSVGSEAWGDRDGLSGIDYYSIRTGEVDYSGCDPDDIAALGIDRGGNAPVRSTTPSSST